MRKHNLVFNSLNLTIAIGSILFASSRPAAHAAEEIAKHQESTQAKASKKPIIRELEITGTRLVPKETIVGAIESRPGTAFDRTVATEDLQKLNSLGWFDPKRLQLIPSMNSDRTVHLKIVAEENPPIEGVRFSGNKFFNDYLLRSYFVDLIGKPQNCVRLSNAIDEIESDYHRTGYTNARFTDCEDKDGIVELTLHEGDIDTSRSLVVHSEQSNSFREGSLYGEFTRRLPKTYADKKRETQDSAAPQLRERRWESNFWHDVLKQQSNLRPTWKLYRLNTEQVEGPKDMNLFKVDPAVLDASQWLPPVKLETEQRWLKYWKYGPFEPDRHHTPY